jgi:hypothetical protein
LTELRYEHLDAQKNKIQAGKAANPEQSFETSLKARINAFVGEEQLAWIYGNDIKGVWDAYVSSETS